jgi:hypothetical protein
MEFWKNKKIETFKGVKKHLQDFTQEELIYEKVKCATDSIYVIETYFYIFDQTKNNGKGEIVPFILFPFQRNLIKSYETNRFNITNKYRQAGVSTVTCAWLATYIAFNSNRSVAIVANKLETARDELMKDVSNFIDMLPPFLHPKISDKDAANHKTYHNNSQVKAFATNSLRGYTPTFLFWDEAAWCDNGESFWTGTLPTLSTGGNAALVSCVTSDTMVWTNLGLQEIKELITPLEQDSYITEEYTVLGKNKQRSGNILHNNGFRPTRIIKNEHTSIECTLNHKLWTYSNKRGTLEYTEASKINLNDYVAIQYGLNIFGTIDEIKYVSKRRFGVYFNYKITNELIDLCSIFLHKGKITNILNNQLFSKDVVFTDLTDDENEIVIKFFNKFNLKYSRYRKTRLVKKENTLVLENDYLSNLLSNFGLDYESKYDTYTNRTLSKFAKRIEGKYLVRLVKKWIILHNNIEIGNDSFTVKHKSFNMLREIQQILLNHGFLCKLNTSTIDSKFTIHELEILCDFENFKIDDYIPKYDQVLPLGIIDKINRILKIYGVDLPFNYYSSSNILNIINELKDVISEKDKIEIDKYISPNIYWSKVIKITSNKNITYDFSLKNNNDDFWAHSVIYNNILGHQTPNGLDPVFYKTYNNAKNGTSEFIANELYWYYDPRYSNDLLWRKKDENGNQLEIKEINKNNFKNLVEGGWKPWSPWYEAMASKFNYDKKKIAQELECVVGDTLITVKNNETGEVEKIKIEEFYDRLNF